MEYIVDSGMLLIVTLLLIIGLIGLIWGICNKLLRSSNWYKNNFIHTQQFLQEFKEKSLDIVNVGSNPAVFAFFYENVKGVNWATGSQGPKMDIDILKRYVSQLKENGIVLIPIVPFSSCTPYLTHYKPLFKGVCSYARYIKALKLSNEDIKDDVNLKKAYNWLKYPLLYQPNAIRYLYHDVNEDNRHLISEQPMSCIELDSDAEKWVNGWKREFDIIELERPVDKRMEECQEECVTQFVSIIDFCKNHRLRPVLILPPVSDALNRKLSNQTKEIYIYSFVRRIQLLTKVDFYNYIDNIEFQSPSLYFNSLFLNLRGRKLFTKRVLEDLELNH